MFSLIFIFNFQYIVHSKTSNSKNNISKPPSCTNSKGEKVSFKKLIKNNRCVAVADGFYEWKREEKEKTPHYFTREDTNVIYFAGIFENDQFCLITEEAKENINEIHHRQPVILNQVDINRYLNLELQGSTFLKERKIPNLIFHEVSKDVNKPTNNSASLIQKV